MRPCHRVAELKFERASPGKLFWSFPTRLFESAKVSLALAPFQRRINLGPGVADPAPGSRQHMGEHPI